MKEPLRKSFLDAASAPPPKEKKEYPKPICVRFTDAERAELESKAGDLTLSAYVRSQCVGDVATPHRTKGKRPVKDQEALGRVLGALGRSQLSNNLNQLAKAAHSGTLGLQEDSEAAIQKAAYDIAYISGAAVRCDAAKSERACPTVHAQNSLNPMSHIKISCNALPARTANAEKNRVRRRNLRVGLK